MGQVFYAHPTNTVAFPNGAIGHRTGSGSFDCLGPYAKVRNCPIADTNGAVRLTCYATGVADTFFSIPACTRYRGKYVSGYFSTENGAIEFRPHNRHRNHFGLFAPDDFNVIPVFHEFGNGFYFRIVHIKSGRESVWMRSWECDEVIRLACAGKLNGDYAGASVCSFLEGVKP